MFHLKQKWRTFQRASDGHRQYHSIQEHRCGFVGNLRNRRKEFQQAFSLSVFIGELLNKFKKGDRHQID